MSSKTPNDPGKESDGSNGRRPNPNRSSNVLRTEDMGINPVVGGGDDGVLFDNLSDPTALLVFIRGQGIRMPRNGDPPTEDPRNADYINLENVQRAVNNMEASLNNVSNRQNPQSSAPVISPQRAVKRERQDSDEAKPEARASKKCRQGPEEAQQGSQAPNGEALRARHNGSQRPDCQYPNPMPYVNRTVQQGTGPRRCRSIKPNVRRRPEWGAADFGPGGFGPQAIPVNNMPPGMSNLPPEMNNLPPEINNASNMNPPMAQAPHHLMAYPTAGNGMLGFQEAAQRNHPPPHHARPGPQNYSPNPSYINFQQGPHMLPQEAGHMQLMPQMGRHMGPQGHHMNGGQMHNTNVVYAPHPDVVMHQHIHRTGPQIPPQVPVENGEHMSYENVAYVPHAPRQWPPIPQMPDMNGNMHQTNLVYIPDAVRAPQQLMMPMPQIGPQMPAHRI